MNHSRLFHRIHRQYLDCTVSSLCPHCPLLPQKVSVIRIHEDRMPSIKGTKGQRQILENTAVVSVTGIRIPLGIPPLCNRLNDCSDGGRSGRMLTHSSRKRPHSGSPSGSQFGGPCLLLRWFFSIFSSNGGPIRKLFPLRGRSLGPKSLSIVPP